MFQSLKENFFRYFTVCIKRKDSDGLFNGPDLNSGCNKQLLIRQELDPGFGRKVLEETLLRQDLDLDPRPLRKPKVLEQKLRDQNSKVVKFSIPD